MVSQFLSWTKCQIYNSEISWLIVPKLCFDTPTEITASVWSIISFLSDSALIFTLFTVKLYLVVRLNKKIVLYRWDRTFNAEHFGWHFRTLWSPQKHFRPKLKFLWWIYILQTHTQSSIYRCRKTPGASLSCLALCSTLPQNDRNYVLNFFLFNFKC